jgi:hypothetical protein
VATRLRAVLLTLGLVLVGVVGVASPASASAPVLLSGSAWLDGEGVNVCTNNNGGGSDPSCGGETQIGNVTGAYWQCVELAQRLYTARGWHSGIFSGVPYGAYQIYDAVSANSMTRQANGSITSIVPGDMIIHGTDEPYSGGAGHVAIVDYISGSTVYTVSQNTYNDQPVGTYTLSGGTLTKSGSGTIRGVVHDPNNTNTSGGGTSAARAGIRNGGFNNGTSYWTRTGSANMVAYGVSGAYEGDGYGATNAAAAGDSIRQDVALNSSAGHSYCVSAQVRTDGSGSGAAGSIAVYVLGSTATQGSSKPFSGLTSNWKPVEACVTATSSHITLRVQIYPTVGAPTLAVDAIDMRESLVNSAGFNGSSSGWAKTGTANFVTYGPSGTYEGTGYAATNASAAGDSLYQNVTRTLTVGATYCVSAMVRSDYTGATSSGTLALWMLGGSSNENSTYRFNNIGNDWTPVKTCVAATVAHTSLRVQFYPDVSAPTIGVDAVALHPTLAVNGGFNIGTSNWSASGSANFVTYGPTGAYEGSAYAATNASVSNDSIRQDATRTIDAGDMYCVSAMVRSDYTGATSSGTLALWMLGTSATESSVIPFTNIGNDWTPVKTCVTATSDHTSLRVQIYPVVGAPTIGVDAVDMG